MGLPTQGMQSNNFAPLSTKYFASVGDRCSPSWKDVELGLFNLKTLLVFLSFLNLLFSNFFFLFFFFMSSLQLNNGHTRFFDYSRSQAYPPTKPHEQQPIAIHIMQSHWFQNLAIPARSLLAQRFFRSASQKQAIVLHLQLRGLSSTPSSQISSLVFNVC